MSKEVCVYCHFKSVITRRYKRGYRTKCTKCGMQGTYEENKTLAWMKYEDFLRVKNSCQTTKNVVQ